MADICAFCDRIRMQKWNMVMSNMCAFEPDKPVVPGHMVVVPFAHVETTQDFMPSFFGVLAGYAVTVARQCKMKEYNLVLSVGVAAGQSTGHMHLELIPRKRRDGLVVARRVPGKIPESETDE